MEFIYNIIETIFPFSFIQYSFIKNAFIAIIIIGPLFGIVGTMVVNNKMAFFSDALGHSALSGIAIGTLFGISNVNISTIIFAIIFSLLLNRIRRSNILSSDTIISVFSSLGIALGLAILSKGNSFSKYSSLLLGDILSITPIELLLLFIVFILVIIFWITSFNKLHATSINTSLAKAKGINANLIDDIFVVFISIIVMLSIKWVGILLINALLILPAASSKNIAINIREYHAFSVVFSLFSGLMGIVISYYYDISTGPIIVIILSTIFFITHMLGKYIKKLS